MGFLSLPGLRCIVSCRVVTVTCWPAKTPGYPSYWGISNKQEILIILFLPLVITLLYRGLPGVPDPVRR